MRTTATLLALCFLGLLPAARPALAVDWDVKSDTWVATDALGRALPGYAECGPPRNNRQVGIFYFLWLGQHGTGGPYDITKILAANPTEPQWGPLWTFHHWGESEMGYYLSDDPYVIRKHCHELVNAGADTLIFDVTNSYTYTTNYMLLCSIFQQIRDEGGATPQICFLVNGNNVATVQKLYDELYSQNLYSDLWFRWLGKPLILSPPEGLTQQMLDFFTIRQCWAWSNSWWFPGPTALDKWTWLDNFPQGYGYHGDPSVPEEASVCVAQHPTSNIGRSFHNGAQPATDQYSLCPTTGEGLCFAEQWSRIIEPPVDPDAEIDPEFLFITGWNEWVAQRFTSSGADTFLGRVLPAGETLFVDTYNQEYSRDIEPMKGGHTDNYYYQMIANIRRRKGVRPLETPTAPQTIAIDGSFGDWADVAPEYRDHSGDKVARNHAGWGSAGTYVNNTGRNDFLTLKVARDAGFIYFYAETKDSITPCTDPNWMLLFIDADCNASTGWNGYDYIVNSSVVNSNTTTLKRSLGGWNWTLVRNVSYRYSGNKIEIAIPRADIGQSGGTDVALDFHWADNIQNPDDIIEFSVSGDSAPDRRFNYRCNTPVGPVTDFTALPGPASVILTWSNPLETDLARVVIRCKTSGYPVSDTDGQLVVDRAAAPGAGETYTHSDLGSATYYYAVFAYDGIPSRSSPAVASATPGCVAVWLNENFNNYSDGNLGGQGSWTTTGSASAHVESTYARSGKAALMDTVASGTGIANRIAFGARSGGYHYATLDVSQEAGGSLGQANGYVSFQASDSSEIARIHLQKSRLMLGYGSGSYAILMVGAVDLTWYKIKVGFNIDTRRIDIWIDGASRGSGLAFKGSGTNLAGIEIGSDRNTSLNPQKLYVENVLGEARPTTVAEVRDDGAWTPSLSKLRFAFDPAPCAGEYQYAIGTSAGGSNIRGWTTCGQATDVLATGLTLTDNATYYVSAQVGTGNGTWGASVTSNGIKVAPGVAILEAKGLPDGTAADAKAIRGKAISATFPGFFYIQDGYQGLRAFSSASVSEGDEVDICGVMRGSGSERYLDCTGNSVIKTVPGPGAPHPIALNNAALGGSSLNPLAPGVVGGVGLNNIGLLVRICGEVTSVGALSFQITDGAEAAVTVTVSDSGDVPAEGSYVSVTGISSIDASLNRTIRALRSTGVTLLRGSQS